MSRQLIPAAEPVRDDINGNSTPAEYLTLHPLAPPDQTKADAIAQRCGFERYEPDAWIGHLAFLERRSNHDLLEMGKIISAAAEILGGEVGKLCDASGISRTKGYRLAKAWRVWGKNAGRIEFAKQTTSSNLMELMALPDDQLDALIAGEIDGASPADVPLMSIAETRKLVKKLKDDHAATDELIKAKDAKINELDRKLRYWARTPEREKAETILIDAAEASIEMQGVLHRLQTAINSARGVFIESGEPMPSDVDDTIQGLVRPLTDTLHHLCRLIGE